MPTPAQTQAIVVAISAIRNAQNGLAALGRQTTDQKISTQIFYEINFLNTVLTQVSQAQTISDDATFAQATITLKQEATILNTQATVISSIITNVGTAATIVGYIAQAATALASL